MYDLLNRIDVRRAISPAAATTDNTPIVSQIINLAGYDSCVFALLLGSLADADATFAVTMTHGSQANLSDGVAVPANNIEGSLALASFDFSDDNQERKVGYKGNKQYVQLTITPSNNTGNVFIAATAILGNARYAPTPATPAA